MDEQVKKYTEKLEQIEAERDNLKGDFYLQLKIEAHLEMLCAMGIDRAKKGKRGGKEV
jgi:hypothetical protein